MTKQEAIQAMQAGAKVTHRFFESNEWVTMEGKQTIITEEGYAFSATLFWKYRTSIEWETDWKIYGT